MASGSSFAPLVLESRRGSVSTITLNRADRLNALNSALGQALLDALSGAMHDNAVRAVVLTGAGRGFCAGGDVDLLRKAREREDVTEVEALLKLGKRIILAIATMPKPVIAAINGPAAGAGANLALACTTRIASEQASFIQSFAKIGVFPDFGGTYFLPRLVGPSLAMELMLTAETVSAADALRIGLVSRVVPPDSPRSRNGSAGRSVGCRAADCGSRNQTGPLPGRSRTARKGAGRGDSLAGDLLSFERLP